MAPDEHPVPVPVPVPVGEVRSQRAGVDHDVEHTLVVAVVRADELRGKHAEERFERGRAAEDGSRADARGVADSREHGGAVSTTSLDPSAVVRALAHAGVFGLGDERDAVGGDARGDVSLKDDVGRVRQGDALRVGAVDEELLEVGAVGEESADDDLGVRGGDETDEDAVLRAPRGPLRALRGGGGGGEDHDGVGGGVVVLAEGEHEGEEHAGVADVRLGRQEHGLDAVGGERVRLSPRGGDALGIAHVVARVVR